MTRTSRGLMVGIALGVAVFAGISIYGDTTEVADRLAGFDWWAMGAALALALANYLIRFVRWELYLRAVDVRVPRTTSGLVFVAGFALSITPGKIGELIKSYLLRQTDRVPIARSAPVVVIERITDLIALMILGLVGVASYGIAVELVIAAGAVVGVGLLILAWPRLGHAVIRLVSRPRRLRGLGARLREFYDGLVALARPDRLAWATALGLLAWLAECLGFALIVRAFPGVDISLGVATLIYASTTIAGALSFLPGGLVVTEAAMTLLLVESALGMDDATAGAATILTRLATLWFAVVLGVIAMAALRRRAPATADTLEQSDATAPE